MHHLETKNGVHFNFNGDYSGDICITAKNWDSDDVSSIKVSFEDLKHFVASAIRSEMISKYEQMEDDDLLGINR